mgnify:CR=1 FL=1
MKIKDLFDSAAQSYDATRRKYISCIDDFYGVAIEQIPYEATDTFTVLDLGAGTGLLAAMASQAFPNARFVLCDVSAEMLKQAENRFGSDARFSYRVLDFDAEGLEGKYDVIISALAIHHIPEARLKPLFQRIYEGLNKHGVFINADQILGETRAIESAYEGAWLRHARSAGCSEEEILIAIKRMEADRTSPLSIQLETMRDVGFTMVNCWYQFYRYATYSGRRPH